MASVEELRARLEKLSTDIDLQKEVLKKLEKDRSLVQWQLNAVLDPVARLPFEISSAIFLHCLPATLAEVGARHVPMLLLNICNTWSNIALSTPSLWAAIHIVFPRPDGFKELLPAWLQRAGNRLLSVTLRGTVDGDVAAIIWRHGQLKHLEICCDEDEDDDEDSDEDTNVIDLFGGMSPGPLPFLETLTIRGFADARGQGYPGLQMRELLRMAPNLVECIFDSMSPVYDIEIAAPTAEKLVLPALRRMVFGGSLRNPDSDDEILTHITLPALETLSLWLDISGNDLLAFFQRSSPPIQDLFVGSGSAHLDSDELHECFRLLPTLTRFEIRRPTLILVAKLFDALADSPSLLPNLHSLIIHLYSSSMPDSSWKTLLRALSTRRTQLQIVQVQLYVGPPLSLKPGADVLAAFRELIADGMQVHIGTQDSNFISADPSV
ncbi:hypothetical protein B0H13DRAFT_304508 [Mycena leptocephala]|nr:hypothetical protein B0H13DRAFT_304508 [Mycena leptocephala]